MESTTAAKLLDEIDMQARMLAHLVENLENRARTQGDVDARSIATAKTQLQGGLKWLRDGVRKPVF